MYSANNHATQPLGLAMMTNLLWKPGSKLRIGFKGGSIWQKDRVKKYALEWCKFANIAFTFVDSGELDILIAFDPTKESSSRLGVDCAWYSSQDQPSMNPNCINNNTSESLIRYAILHEFGHALGAIHEHQSPCVQIPWDKEEVYRDLGNHPIGWDIATVDYNMFSIEQNRDIQATSFDPNSIMMYEIRDNWTKNGKGVSPNLKLSCLDKGHIRLCYPNEAHDASQPNVVAARPKEKSQLATASGLDQEEATL
ncbi:uncharacterized protein F4822DRAFT_416093 [Hypoxylon trugodes]|uniref:uncharacterized protein n=1 Tax=Hypoxylon trugodes TaxID=326681 RepID=UPI002191DA15|nr:uncharacterized protein F4822DRAFT_416093 [Hypoxylon trugodes]KAI1384729.1 hypothetical protein F4822DRAFT_416093 [Hypoxylon trugodes]